MFKTADLDHTMDKDTYNAQVPQLRTDLLQAQRDLAASSKSVVVIVSGVEGAGKSETVNLLLEWMDARGIETHSLWQGTKGECERPPYWRFWQVLPARGRLAIFFGSWYTQPILDRVFKRTRRGRFERELDRILQLECMLHNEDTIVVKFWMHLSKQTQKKRFHDLEKDPKQNWRVTALDRKFLRHIDQFREVCEFALQKTHSPHAPWHVIPANDARHRNLTVARTLLDSIRQGLKSSPTNVAAATTTTNELTSSDASLLRQLDLTKSLALEVYERDLLKFQNKLTLLCRRLREAQRSLILVFEGPDAAGKGGTIRKLTTAMDARDYQVVCVGAPNDEERNHPYLWRFWRGLPGPGRVTIYDRSWYGRVLVERIEGLCPSDAWQRAYAEINNFEEQLTDFGTILLKFWLAISPEEQLQRFENRQTTPFKQYKLTEEDWRNRAKWNNYEAAACDMFEATSRPKAPWVLIEANNKEWARVKVLKTLVKRLEQDLGD
jgi:polyphosphate:AMP phosphotransferase